MHLRSSLDFHHSFIAHTDKAQMVASSASAGFIQHGSGVQRILEFRGPEAHQTDPALGIFESIRLALFYVFLEWQTIPWMKNPEAKTLLSRVVDRLCFLP
jgi:hypothetical protein